MRRGEMKFPFSPLAQLQNYTCFTSRNKFFFAYRGTDILEVERGRGLGEREIHVGGGGGRVDSIK